MPSPRGCIKSLRNWRQGLLLPLLCAATACGTHSVFRRPMTVSTRSSSTLPYDRLATVEATTCAGHFLFVPFGDGGSDELVQELLQKARNVGGTTVLDTRIEHSGETHLLFLYGRSCRRAVGVAARPIPIGK